MKRRRLPLLFLLLVFTLSGCSTGPEGSAPGAGTREPDPPEVATPAGSVEPPAGGGEPSAGGDGEGAWLRTDADGLVGVRIEDGNAEISYCLEQWDALHDIYAVLGTDTLGEGPFAIVTEGAAVADACVGKVEALDMWGYEDFVLPSVVLLMADGTVEYAVADPFETRMDNMVYSHGTIPWLSGIASLSFEATGEGIGGHTVCAVGGDGVRHDVSAAVLFRSLLWHDEWACALDAQPEDFGGYHGYLCFADESRVTFNIGGGFEVVDSYVGSYRIVLSDEDPEGYPKGSMVFDLDLDWTVAEAGEGGAPDDAFPRRRIRGSYFAEMTDELELRLWLGEGDCLYDNRYGGLNGPKTEYVFAPPAWDADGDGQGYHEMAVQFVCDHPAVQEQLALGMVAVSTGQTTLIDGLVCYDVALGTDNGDSFVREVHYTFNFETWSIYRYDALTDSWIALGAG